MWPLAYVCLVPWVIAVCAGSRPRVVYVVSYLLGAAFFLVNLRWLRFSTYPGYIALCLWSGIHFLVAAWGFRHAYRKRAILLSVAVPVIWVLSELARSRTAVGFPWFLLGHSQHRLLSMIQISDMAGAFGVSFVVAAVNGWVCDVVLERLRLARSAGPGAGGWRSRRLIASTVFTWAVVIFTIAYGRFRLGTQQFAPGPRIAVLQGDYPLTPFLVINPLKQRELYMGLLEAAAGQSPDLFLLPETPWSMSLNREYRELDPLRRRDVPFSRQCHEMFCEASGRHNAYVVVGSLSHEEHPTRVYPRYERFNSAFVYRPERSTTAPAECPEPLRYDKIHLVLFGEYVPFRYGRLHFVYRWLNSLTPWGAQGEEYSLTAGKDYAVFHMRAPSQDGRQYRFAVPICYEDAIPQVIRRFVTGPDGGKRVDFLLNISNDGWFWHSTELPQHLVICAFRAVENRVAIARAVNTGISGFIDPDGRIRDIVEDDNPNPSARKEPWEGVAGYRVSELRLDPRHTLYSRFGDWFAWACAIVGLVCYLDAFAARLRANWQPRGGAEE